MEDIEKSDAELIAKAIETASLTISGQLIRLVQEVQELGDLFEELGGLKGEEESNE